jgi:hypothetical protein
VILFSIEHLLQFALQKSEKNWWNLPFCV